MDRHNIIFYRKDRNVLMEKPIQHTLIMVCNTPLVLCNEIKARLLHIGISPFIEIDQQKACIKVLFFTMHTDPLFCLPADRILHSRNSASMHIPIPKFIYTITDDHVTVQIQAAGNIRRKHTSNK